MKNKLIVLLLFLIVFCLYGCNNNQDKPLNDELKLILISNNSVVKELIVNKSQLDVELPMLEEESRIFKGWFLDPNCENIFKVDKILDYFTRSELPLYASWSIKENMNKIEILGTSFEDVLINPVFKFDNRYNDVSFTIKLMKGEEVICESIQNSLVYRLNDLLEYNTSYTLSVLGKESGNVTTISFKTIAEKNYNIKKPIVLDNPFSDNMVIQREEDIVISGVGPEMMVVCIKLGEEEFYGVSNEKGNFSVVIPRREVSFTPTDIIINCHKVNKTIKNVLFGDVYLFCGQSNMQWPANKSDYREVDVDKAIENDVRFFCQDVATSNTEQQYVKNGRWFSTSRLTSNYAYFSAISFMTGSMLGEELKNEAPIGIITAYQGDTNIVNWMSKDYYDGKINTKNIHYNQMIAPLKGTAIKGVVWYQGCNNSAAGGDYLGLLKDFFRNYRDIFNKDKLPFYVIGLCCYDGDSGNNFDFSYVREAQQKACASDENAYFINSCDGGDPTFIHPTEKRYICSRVCKSILSSIYGFNYMSEGPTYKSHVVDGNKVIITLNNSTGLYAKSKIQGMMLAGADGKYYNAEVSILNDQLICTSLEVDNPVYIKYGFSKSPFVNVFNQDGYSLAPFRTDNYGENIDIFNYNDKSLYTNHPDGSKLTIDILEDSSLKFTKAKDGISYGSARLNVWGMVSLNNSKFVLTIEGTNSLANISVRFIEGASYEIWQIKIQDNFVGEKTFTFSLDDFTCVYNKQDNVMNLQAISYIELMIESMNEVEVNIKGAKFTD